MNEIIKDTQKCINLNYGNSSRSHLHVNKYIGDNRVRRRISRNRQNADNFYQLLNGMKIPYEPKVENNKMNRNGLPLWNSIDGYNIAEVKLRNVVQKNLNPLVYQLRKSKRNKQYLKRKLRIRNANDQMKTSDNKLPKDPIHINKKDSQSANNLSRYCCASGPSSTDVNEKR